MAKAVHLRWGGGLLFEGSSALGGRSTLDGADAAHAMRPMEHLLGALAGCTGMDVISICAKKRQAIATYEVVATGEQRESHPQTFADIVVEHRFAGEDVDAAAVRRAVELSAIRYCPVNAHISAGDTRVVHRYVLLTQAGELSEQVAVTGPFGAGREPDAR